MCVHLFACEQVLGERERVSTKQSNDQREESVCMYRAYIVTSEKVYDELGFKRCRPFVRFFYFFFFFPRTFFFPFLAFRIALFFSTINRILIPSFFFFFFPFHYHPSSRDDVTWISKRGSFEGTAFGSIVPQLVMYSA